MARGYFCGGGFSGVDCDDATAVEGDILEGRTAGISGKDDLVQGRMPERGDWGSTELAAGASIIIPGGHHSGKGKVTAKSLTSQTPGNLAANKMLAGTYGWSGGRRFDGEIASQGPITLKPGTTAKTGSVSGKYMTGNITVPAISIPASAIKKGHKITFPDGSSVTGTFEGYVANLNELYNRGANAAGFTVGICSGSTGGVTFNSNSIDFSYGSDGYNQKSIKASKSYNFSGYSKLKVAFVFNKISTAKETELYLGIQGNISTPVTDKVPSVKVPKPSSSTEECTAVFDVSKLYETFAPSIGVSPLRHTIRVLRIWLE